jgi:hypothetical protein
VLVPENAMKIAKRIKARRRVESVEQIAQGSAMTAQLLLRICDPIICGLWMFSLVVSMWDLLFMLT